MKTSKYENLIIVQGYYDGHWEDLDATLLMREAKINLRKYIDNERGTSFRIISRHTLKPLETSK